MVRVFERICFDWVDRFWSVPSTDYDLQRHRWVPYHKLSNSIALMKFSVAALDDFCDFNRRYFVIDLQLYSSAINGVMADASSASDANNTKFTYVVNNIAHSIFKQINRTEWTRSNLFMGNVPQRMIVSLLDTTAFNGESGQEPAA